MAATHGALARSTRRALMLAGIVALLILGTSAAIAGPASCTGALDSAAEIQQAMLNALPGTVILIAPGVHVGNRSTSGDPGSQGLFYSGRSGTAANPIVIMSCDPANPGILKGASVSDGSYGLHLTGDHWQVKNLVVTQAQKGIVIDNGNHNLLSGLEVHTIGDEGVHFRDGSSYNTLEHSRVHDTGKREPGFGEGAYVGSDAAASYEHVVLDNVIRHTVFGGAVTAEHIDIKEGADGTVVEFCTFDGAGITGANSADSFVDVKGVNSIVRYNQGSRNGNGAVVDAFQVRTHGSGFATGRNNAFYYNTADLDGASGFVVYATSATTGTTAFGDVRIGGGNLYSSNVKVLPNVDVQETSPTRAFRVSASPNPAAGDIRFSCDVDGEGPGTVAVFDLSGRRVVELASARFTPGRQVFRWNGRGAEGRPSSGGIYYVRVTVGTREAVCRFALLR